MKNLKIVLASLLLVAGMITFSSFKSDTYSKNAFEIVCFYYIGPQAPVLGDITDPLNWDDQIAFPPDGRCDDPNFLCAICIDDDDVFEGKPEAAVLALVEDVVVVEDDLPEYSQGEEIPDTDIQIYQKSEE